MKKFNLSSKQIITWICVNYGLFILAFFTLGFMGSKSAVIINFVSVSYTHLRAHET